MDMTISRNFSLSRLCFFSFSLLQTVSSSIFFFSFSFPLSLECCHSLYFFSLFLSSSSFFSLFLSCTLHAVFFFFLFCFCFLFCLFQSCMLFSFFLSFFLSLTLSPADSLFSFQIWCVELFYGFCKLEFCELFRFFFILQICVLLVFRSEEKRSGKRRGSQFWLI